MAGHTWTRFGCLHFIALVSVAIIGIVAYNRTQTASHPFRILKAGVWTQTTFDPVFDRRGAFFGSRAERVLYKFTDSAVTMRYYSGKTDDSGLVPESSITKTGDAVVPILSVEEYTSGPQPAIVIHTRDWTRTYVHKPAYKSFEIFSGNTLVGRIFKDPVRSLYPDQN